MACAGAITANVLTAGAGMVGAVGGDVLKSTSGITNSITDSVTGLTGNVSMASMVSETNGIQALSSSTALTSTIGKVGALGGTMPQSFSNMASGLGENVFSGGFDVFSGDALSIMGPVAGIGSVMPTGLLDAAKTMGGSISGVDILGNAKKFGSILGSAEGFVGSANGFISAAKNSASVFSGGTFPGMDSVMSGGLTGITNALPDFGGDLASLGSTINFDSISNLGSPGQLLKNMDIAGNLGPMYDKLADITVDPRIAGALGGGLSTVTNAISAGTGGLTLGSLGVDLNKIADIGPLLPNNIQSQIYNQFDGLSLAELGDVKGILGNTQAAITKGGDLMNPQKLFPTSFSTLTAPLRTASVGNRAIYTASGSVNEQFTDLGIDLAGALPDDLAVANGALSRSMGQIKGIDATTSSLLSTATTTAETLKGLNLVNDQSEYVTPAVSNFWQNFYGVQSNITLATGPDGTFTVSDAIGYAAGYNSAAPLQQNKILLQELITSGAMNVFTQDSGSGSASTGIYKVIDYFCDGAYNPTPPAVAPFVIPAGVYGAGSYATQTLAFEAIIAAAKTLIQTFFTNNPNAQLMQRNSKRIQEQQAREKLIRVKMDLDLAVVQAQDNVAIQLASNLPSYALDTTEGGTSQLLERVMNFSSTGGQAAVGAMREARNLDKLLTANIQIDAPIPTTPPANPGAIAPSTFTVAQADAIIVRS